MAKKQPIPAFCRGTVENLTAAISEGGRFHDLDRILWCYINEGDRVGELAFVMPPEEDGDPIISYIAGDNICNIAFLDSLPTPSEAKEGMLYVVEDKGYHYNGADYIKLFDEAEIDILRQAVTEDSENLHNAFDALRQEFSVVSTSVVNLESRVQSVEETSQTLVTEVDQMKSSFDVLQDTVNEHSDTLESITEVIGDLGDINARVTAVEEDMADLDSLVNTLDNSVSDLESRVSTNASNIESMGANVTSIGNRMTNAESDISDLQDMMQMEFI